MASVYRYRVALTGWPGAPGVNTIWARSPEGGTLSDANLGFFATEIAGAYEASKAFLATNVKAQVESTVDEFEDTTFTLLSRRGIGTVAQVEASSVASTTSRASMLKMQFRTNVVRGNRLLRGGFFFGPIRTNAIDGATGAVEATALNTVRTAFQELADYSLVSLAVYGQPFAGDPASSPPKPARAGLAAGVDVVDVFPLPAVMRSRRQ